MGYNNLFCCFTFNDSNNVLYSSLIMQSNNVFGCVSLNRKSYCILNKQYSKEEYEELVPRIIEQMKLESKNITPASLPPTHYHLQPSFGDFFPTSLSPFGYNETVTREYFPLTKQQVEARGWNWYIDPEEQTQTAPVTGKDILKCQQCGHAYKIIPQEMKFYYEMKLPVPLKCADCRHHARMAQRNPQKLWERKCMKCYKAIKTTYAPDRPETVYCEECYLELV